jgi:threonine dehydrogenase-like Zn-dependent dehydrogenase
MITKEKHAHRVFFFRDHARARVDARGICGTDIHIMDGEFPPTPYPITPGHEFSGTVVAVAGDVRMNLPVGAKVAVDPSLYCGYGEDGLSAGCG